MKLKITILSVCLVVSSTLTMAQDNGSTTTSTTSSSTNSSSDYGLPKKKDFDKFSAGISIGPNFFQGDVQHNTKNNNSLKELPFNMMYGAQINYQLTHTVGFRLRGMVGKFTADNREALSQQGPTMYVFFESPIKEATLEATFTAGNISFLKRNKKFHLIGSLGYGMFNYDATLKDSSGKLIRATGNVTEGVMIVAGMGVKYQVGKRIDAGLTYNFRKTLTDKIDAINLQYTETDNYSILALSLNYTFGKKQQQMEWVNPMEIVYNDLADMKDRVDALSNDKDKDGVSDMFDRDNSTPEGIKVYGDGTAVDTDGDGVPDHLDNDPYTSKGAKVDANGVEIDSDGDGVPDSRDLEPNTAKGNLVNFQGTTINKPSDIASASNKNAVGWLPSIFFDIDKTNIQGIQRDRVLIVARVLKNNPDLKIKITGNCDPTAGEDYNQKLGMRRAESVKNHLVKIYGIDASRITTESKGENDIFAKGINAMNRRVDFSVEQ